MRNWAENQIKLVFIRHGLTKSNKEHRYLGKSNESLCPDGVDALEKGKLQGIYPKADYLFSGPMKRCMETAKILYPDSEIKMMPEWTEIDFGNFEGKNYAELKDDESYQAWIDSNGTLAFPGGESREVFLQRCVDGFEQMLEYLWRQLEKKEKQNAGGNPPIKKSGQGSKQEITVAMIVHGGTIMSLLSFYGEGDYFDYQTANGGGYRCILGNSGEKLEFSGITVLGAEQ